MSKRSLTAKILGLFFERKKTAAALVTLVILAAGFDIAVPFITQKLIDTLIAYFREPGGNIVSTLILSSAAILVTTILTRLIRSVYDYHLYKTVTQIDDGLRYRATDKYLSMHALFHYSAHSGQIIGRIERGCTGVFNILLDVMGQNLAPPVMVFAGVLAALAVKNAWIALIVALPLPIYLVVIRKLSETIYEVERKVNDQFEEVSREAYDIAGNALTVKKFSREHEEALYQKRLMEKARVTQFSVLRLWLILENTQTLIATAGRVSVIVVAGLFVLYERATVGEFVLYITLQNMAYAPVSQLSIIFPRLRRNLAAAERIFSLLDEPNQVTDKPDAPPLPLLQHAIEFKDVWFRYSDEGRWVLRDINITIPAGATVALVGRSGSGKTTFANLLLRSYDPPRGSVSIDGVDIRDVTQKSLRSQIAVVPQEVDLFSRSIAENIAYGHPGATPQEIEEAARTALAHDFIVDTENGYKTIVGERGLKLSGGERQRIGIARAVLRDPRILILDEATSHLDTESEQYIQRATDNLIQGRTAVIIAHRLSTVLNADLILVFNEGRIEASGSHIELLGKSPTYRKLYSIQLEGAELSEPANAELLDKDLDAVAEPAGV